MDADDPCIAPPAPASPAVSTHGMTIYVCRCGGRYTALDETCPSCARPAVISITQLRADLTATRTALDAASAEREDAEQRLFAQIAEGDAEAERLRAAFCITPDNRGLEVQLLDIATQFRAATAERASRQADGDRLDKLHILGRSLHAPPDGCGWSVEGGPDCPTPRSAIDAVPIQPEDMERARQLLEKADRRVRDLFEALERTRAARTAPPQPEALTRDD